MDEGRGKERMWRFLSGFTDKVTFQLFCGGRKGIFFLQNGYIEGRHPRQRQKN